MMTRLETKQKANVGFSKRTIIFWGFIIFIYCAYLGKATYENLIEMSKKVDEWGSILNSISNTLSLIIAFFAAILAITLIVGRYYEKNNIRLNLLPVVVVGIICAINIQKISEVQMMLAVGNINNISVQIAFLCASNSFAGYILICAVVINMRYLVEYIKDKFKDNRNGDKCPTKV